MLKIFKTIWITISNSIFLNPIWITQYRLKSHLRDAILFSEISRGDKWLDVGCGLRPYENYFPKGCYVGVDIEDSGRSKEMKAPDFFYDGLKLPFADNSFSGVICTQVLEHVPNPDKLLLEINRVLKLDGEAIISVPFLWPEHEQPYDFYRFTRFGIKDHLIRNGFEVISISSDTGAIEAMVVMLNIYILSNLVPPIKGLGRIISFFICFPIQLIGIFMHKIMPDNGHLYLNIVVTSKKLFNGNDN